MSDPRPVPPRRLVRPQHGAMLGGVCAGIATYARIDPTVVRLIAVVGGLLTLPISVIAYLLCWALIPKEA